MSRYNEALKDVVRTPVVIDGYRSVHAQYTIEVDQREDFQEKMKQKGVPTMVHYPQVMSKQPVYGELYRDVENSSRRKGPPLESFRYRCIPI